MSNEIAIVKNDSCVAAIREFGKCPDLEIWVDTHGEFVIDLPVDVYDALRQLLNNPAVVEHYESLRKPRYENGCTGDPVLVPGSFRTERNKP